MLLPSGGCGRMNREGCTLNGSDAAQIIVAGTINCHYKASTHKHQRSQWTVSVQWHFVDFYDWIDLYEVVHLKSEEKMYCHSAYSAFAWFLSEYCTLGWWVGPSHQLKTSTFVLLVCRKDQLVKLWLSGWAEQPERHLAAWLSWDRDHLLPASQYMFKHAITSQLDSFSCILFSKCQAVKCRSLRHNHLNPFTSHTTYCRLFIWLYLKVYIWMCVEIFTV